MFIYLKIYKNKYIINCECEILPVKTFFKDFSLKDGVKSLNNQDSACLIYETEDELFNFLIPLIKSILDDNNAFFGILTEKGIEITKKLLQEEGIAVDEKERSGQIVFKVFSEIYEPRGFFNIGSAISFFNKMVPQTINKGFGLVNIFTAIHLRHDKYPNSYNLIRSVIGLNKKNENYNVITIKAFPTYKMDKETLKDQMLIHPILIKDGVIYENKFYINPEDYLNKKQEDDEISSFIEYLGIEEDIPLEGAENRDNRFEDANVPFLNFKDNGVILSSNNALAEILGYKLNELLKLNLFFDLVPTKWHANGYDKLKHANTKGLITYPLELKHKNGTLIPIQITVRAFFDNASESYIYYSTIIDLSDFKESENKYQALLYNSNIGVLILENEKIIECNPKAIEMYQCSPNKLINHSVVEFSPAIQMTGETSEEKAKMHIEAALNGETQEFEWIHLKEDGTPFLAVVNLSRVELNGKYHIQGIITDITEKRILENDMLYTSYLDEILSNIYPILMSDDATLDSIASILLEKSKQLTGSEIGYISVITDDEKILWTNNPEMMIDVPNNVEFENLYMHVFPSKDESGKYPGLWGETLNTLTGKYLNNISETENLPVGHPNLNNFISVPAYIGSEVYGQITLANSSRNYEDRDLEALERIAQYYALSIQRLESKDDLVKTLNVNKLLLREIHHRVKNNLQIVSSLLNLQSSKTDDEDIKKFFNLTQDKIRTISLIHEKLYESPLDNINMSNYISDLIENLNMLPDFSKINITLDIKNIFLNLDTALPCGLILNELICNSVDYAYPNKEGDINVKLTTKGQKYELIIEDFGIGFPDDFDFETNVDSIDLYLVKNLVDQLNGEVKIDSTNGTKFIIIFEELIYNARF